MGKKLTTVCLDSEKDFKKQGKVIKKLAKKKGLIAITNRLSNFINKPSRRWWFANKESMVLISMEYGLTDKEAVNFLTNQLST